MLEYKPQINILLTRKNKLVLILKVGMLCTCFQVLKQLFVLNSSNRLKCSNHCRFSQIGQFLGDILELASVPLLLWHSPKTRMVTAEHFCRCRYMLDAAEKPQELIQLL